MLKGRKTLERAPKEYLIWTDERATMLREDDSGISRMKRSTGEEKQQNIVL